MTSVGRFSLKSETQSNRSIPTFFLALAGQKNKSSSSPNDNDDAAMHKYSPNKIFTVSDFENAWLHRSMPTKHPRFHSTVCDELEYFEETHQVHPPATGVDNNESVDEDESTLQIKAELDRHVFETLHYSVYRHDLRNRLEQMLTSPLEVSDKLWEVKISNGLLGSSGAISQVKADAIRKRQHKERQEDIRNVHQECLANSATTSKDRRTMLRRTTTRGGLWKDAKVEAESTPMESVLLFRSHHALADGASIMAALSDLCDEADEIREEIEVKLKQWKQRGLSKRKKSWLRRMLSRFARLVKICLWFSLGTIRAFAYQGYLQLTTWSNPFDAVKRDAEQKGLDLSGRSISWVDAAPLEEAKKIANIIGKARGVSITINDLFVSCVTAAVTRQLIEHEDCMAPINEHKRKFAVKNINVVVPVHLRGGVILPNESIGNNIGAFVTRCPGEMKHDAVGGGTTPCPTERLARVHKSMLSSKRSPAPFVSHYMAKFCSDYLPEEWTKSIFQRANANACVVVSNNRGHHKKLHINGMAVESAAGFLPLPPGIPIGVVVQSYAGTMSMSVTAERYAVPDADKFLRWILDEYQRLREEAAKLEAKQT